MQLVLSTDASGVAWGAHVHGKWEETHTSGKVYNDNKLDTSTLRAHAVDESVRNMRSIFTETEREDWIHILEFKAVHRALTALGPHI